VLAGALLAGHELLAPDGTHSTVESVHNFTGAQTMYNLTVADTHTYYVVAGNVPVLVHNCDIPTHPEGCTCAGPVEPGQPVYRVWGQKRAVLVHGVITGRVPIRELLEAIVTKLVYRT
jgi:hypothetical protein